MVFQTQASTVVKNSASKLSGEGGFSGAR